MLKRCLLTFAFAIFISTCFAQETTEIKRKLSENVTEVFTVLKTDINMRQGPYKALYKKKQTVATGTYDKDKKAGLWTFTNPKGVVLQTYDYTHNRLFYEALEDTTSHLRYFVDKELKEGDKVTKPVKVGGRYYGYLPYLSLFSLPNGYKEIDRDQISATVVLLISPLGRLADYKVSLIAIGQREPFKTVNMNIKLPDPADIIFTPATLNGDPIASRIVIRCYLTYGGHLDFED
jgi:hypothetical protein